MPCGPASSVGLVPTLCLRSTLAPPGPNRTSATSSLPSLATKKRYSRVGGAGRVDLSGLPATFCCTAGPQANSSAAAAARGHLHGTSGSLDSLGFTRTTQSPLLKSFTYASPSLGFTTTPQVNGGVLHVAAHVRRAERRDLAALRAEIALELAGDVEGAEAGVVGAHVERVRHRQTLCTPPYSGLYQATDLGCSMSLTSITCMVPYIRLADASLAPGDAAVQVHLVGDEDVLPPRAARRCACRG